jgi:hypothetical protein
MKSLSERGGAIMNTFWLKIAGAAVAVVLIIVLITMFSSSSTPEPEEPTKTFYDQAEEDKQKFLAAPKAVDSAAPDQTTESKTAVERVPQTIEPPQPPQPVKLYFKELGEIEKIEAERLLGVSVPGRSIGRLPMTGFNLMVESCRQIIRRWPDSYYAYQAQRMLADMPERYQQRYRVTEQEKDVSRFTQPRPGTKPFIMEESR